MRQLTTRLIAIGLLALAAGHLQPSPAQACIQFDRAAETALIDEMIAADKTAPAQKAVLRALRKEMIFLDAKKHPSRDDTLESHWLLTEALRLIGKGRIVATGKPQLDVGVFKINKLPK